MNPFEYLVRKLYGLPTEESLDLIKAKMSARGMGEVSDLPTHDPHFRETDPTMFGAITPIPEAEDYLTSRELHERAKVILKSHGLDCR